MAKHHTKDERSQIVAAWRASKASAETFCKQRGFSKTSLQRWVAEVDDSKGPPPGFVRLEVPTVRTPSGLAVEIGGVRVLVNRDFDAALLRQLVEVLIGEGPL
jgi:hypothetical protein